MDNGVPVLYDTPHLLVAECDRFGTCPPCGFGLYAFVAGAEWSFYIKQIDETQREINPLQNDVSQYGLKKASGPNGSAPYLLISIAPAMEWRRGPHIHPCGR
jgi:hypothetical protein